MRSWNLRLAVLSLSTLSIAAAVACSSSSGDDGSDGDTDAGGGGNDASVNDSGPITTDGGGVDSGADAGVPCTATPCVRQVAVGGAFSCALLDDHTVRCWGANAAGELGSGTLDGGVVTPTTQIPPVAVPGLTDAIALGGTGEYAAVLDAMCAVTSSGAVKCWGDDQYGELGNGLIGPVTTVGPTASNADHAVAIGGGVAHVCVVTDDGGVSCWGSNAFGETGHFSVDGGQRDPNPTLAAFGAAVSFKQVSGGLEHTCAVTTDGNVWCWGYNIYGQLGRAATDGGQQDSVPAQVAGLTDVKEVAAGYATTCAVTNAGVVSCWGVNYQGALGRAGADAAAEAPAPAPEPVSAPTGVTFTQVVPTLLGFSALASDGTVWSWGYNQIGELGQGTLGDSGAVTPGSVSTPTKIPGLANVTQLAGSGAAGHTCARISDGSVKCWGYNASSQTGVAPVDAGVPQFTPVTVAF